MVTIVIDARLLRRVAFGFLIVAAAAAGLLVARTAWAEVDDPALPSVAFLARADNPVDALAASGVAGQLGAPVFLTYPDSLGDDAASGLATADPDVVVLAGGRAALSETVQAQVGALLPDAEVIRKQGSSRTATAVALNSLPTELGFARPMLTGATVGGDAGIAGELTVDGLDVAATITDLQARLEAVEALLAGVSRAGDTLTFAGMNVQVVNGAGATHTTNGLGNLIVGYDEDYTEFACRPAGESLSDPECDYRSDGAADQRGGSHNLVVGVDHSYGSYGGMVVGLDHTVSAPFASVSAGRSNTASGTFAAVAGGTANTASGQGAAISGGNSGTASGGSASISGGSSNTSSGTYTWVAGGIYNEASLQGTTVTGGVRNVADGYFTSVLAGTDNTASGGDTLVAGGTENVTSGSGAAAVFGGHLNEATADWSTVTGGAGNVASGPRSSVSGGRFNEAVGSWSSIAGGRDNTATGAYTSVSGGQNNEPTATYSTIAGGLDGVIGGGATFEHHTLVGDTLFDP